MHRLRDCAWVHARPSAPAVAEEIGVIGQAELSTAVLSGAHAFMVIATDGVWEFLSSQTVVDLVRMMPVTL